MWIPPCEAGPCSSANFLSSSLQFSWISMFHSVSFTVPTKDHSMLLWNRPKEINWQCHQTSAHEVCGHLSGYLLRVQKLLNVDTTGPQETVKWMHLCCKIVCLEDKWSYNCTIYWFFWKSFWFLSFQGALQKVLSGPPRIWGIQHTDKKSSEVWNNWYVQVGHGYQIKK